MAVADLQQKIKFHLVT